LKLVRQSQQAWLAQIAPLFEKPETAIVVATPHTQPVSRGIESDQWSQYQVQRGRADAPIVHPLRFQDPEAVIDQRVVPGISGEPESLLQKRNQYRQVGNFPERPEEFNYWPGIHFAVGGKINSNMPAV